MRVVVAQSAVGYGVYARQSFRRRMRIGRIRGQIIDDPNYSSDYCMDLGENLSLEPAYPFRYLNHSCEPNSEIVQWDFDDHSELWLHAVRHIDAGQELTIDYSWPAEAAIRCHCGTATCRGWIVDVAELGGVGNRPWNAPSCKPSL